MKGLYVAWVLWGFAASAWAQSVTKMCQEAQVPQTPYGPAPMRMEEVATLALMAEAESPFQEAFEWALADACGLLSSTHRIDVGRVDALLSLHRQHARRRQWARWEATLPAQLKVKFEEWKNAYARYVEFCLQNERVLERSSDASWMRHENERLWEVWFDTLETLESGTVPKKVSVQIDESTWPLPFREFVDATWAWVSLRGPKVSKTQLKTWLGQRRVERLKAKTE